MQHLLGNLKKGLLFVISAPSGAGKTTLVRKLTKEFDEVIESISYTTRTPRKNEIEGKDYFFIYEKEFKEKIQNNEFLEHANVFGYYYGTSKVWVNKNLLNKKHVILVIDTQGAMQLKGKISATFIFIAPPSIAELEKRLKQRDKDQDDKSRKIRLSVAKKELLQAKKYDYQIINDDLKAAYEILRSIIIAEEYRIRKK